MAWYGMVGVSYSRQGYLLLWYVMQMVDTVPSLGLARHLPTRERARKPPLFTNVHSKKKRKLSCQYHISIYTPVFLKTS